ncbi:MAG: MBL fold metallo-hydrolase [candidate division KSB1 bacterium]|jgi:glyoxylase-like metal-dependent hydrolase (beta-lactamase superfamily II)|nr:MBL fold metallo-hydrolase [candidate division KSB1 bacterium]
MRYRVGEYELCFLQDGAFWLDGGGYFGVVPKVLWQKLVPADENNRVRLSINPLLVRTREHLVLIDPGLGDKWDQRLRSIYRIERTPSLQESLAARGYGVDEIDIVVATHLHFDHVGACTAVDAEGNAAPVFPRARHFFQRGEWEDALNPNERTRAAYVDADFVPLAAANLVQFVVGSSRIVEGVGVEVTGGHTRCHQIVLIESKGEVAAYFGGILPAVSHLLIAYTMGFDLYPVTVMHKRRELYQRAIEGR